MSDRIEPMTHIDTRVVKNLLISRINEGRDLMKTAAVSTEWKKREKLFQEKCMKAINLIDEGLKIKEGKYNENPVQSSNQGNQSIREVSTEKQESKA